ncbi:hypothetical protein ACS6GB_13325 [Enterobacter hormaechei subsp. xiangfangensis]|uniref:Uncharacterized protein n=4 Tax=Enterobacter hormaechei TaxID=158836 RepID=A0AAP8KR36_9ENTR|nr:MULTISPECIES: hypothetical protein [Enterobacter]CAE7611043.1 hypothetical protein AI2760V1_2509 [Enterobacter cloacae]EJV4343000.1 hypothetical protein [Enterobacter hormaechei]EKW7976986.1 hypothetical protein [Enterobacter hormaechei]ELC7252203.1 hypothetical protein [Enterobacter hormaechei]ELD3283079.1 hypothetical protein [Enterobacter hormaechei]
MTNRDTDSTKLYVKLNKLTIIKQINWQLAEDIEPLVEASEDRIQTAYWAVYGNKNLAIYLRKYKHYFDDIEWAWAEEVQFAIVTEDFHILWKSRGHDQALTELYETVSRQVSGFYELFDDLINI